MSCKLGECQHVCRAEEMTFHQSNNCLYRLVECKNKCGSFIMAKDREIHERQGETGLCKNRGVRCRHDWIGNRVRLHRAVNRSGSSTSNSTMNPQDTSHSKWEDGIVIGFESIKLKIKKNKIWKINISHQTMNEIAGVTVKQGAVTGTLKTAISGYTNCIVVQQTAGGEDFVEACHLLIGSTKVLGHNINTLSCSIEGEKNEEEEEKSDATNNNASSGSKEAATSNVPTKPSKNAMRKGEGTSTRLKVRKKSKEMQKQCTRVVVIIVRNSFYQFIKIQKFKN